MTRTIMSQRPECIAPPGVRTLGGRVPALQADVDEIAMSVTGLNLHR